MVVSPLQDAILVLGVDLLPHDFAKGYSLPEAVCVNRTVGSVFVAADPPAAGRQNRSHYVLFTRIILLFCSPNHFHIGQMLYYLSNQGDTELK